MSDEDSSDDDGYLTFFNGRRAEVWEWEYRQYCQRAVGQVRLPGTCTYHRPG